MGGGNLVCYREGRNKGIFKGVVGEEKSREGVGGVYGVGVVKGDDKMSYVGGGRFGGEIGMLEGKNMGEFRKKEEGYGVGDMLEFESVVLKVLEG